MTEPADPQRYEDALDLPMRSVRLKASAAVTIQRLRSRYLLRSSTPLQWHLERFAELADRVSSADLDELVVQTDDRPPKESAALIVDHFGLADPHRCDVLVRHACPMIDASKIATHSDPVWRGRANSISRLDLTPYDLAGSWEQCWTHTEDQRSFEMCCIPFFLYGISLGDILGVDRDTGAHRIITKSGRRTIRFAFIDDAAAHQEHDDLHDILVGTLGCLVEVRGVHYGAIDIANDDHRANCNGNGPTPRALTRGGTLMQVNADNGHPGFYDTRTSTCFRTRCGKWWENGSSS